MSAFLNGYENFIVCLADADDDDIQKLIDERTAFLNLEYENADSVIDEVFGDMRDIAKKIENTEFASAGMSIGADAAIVGGLYSFGMSTAVYAALTIGEMVLSTKVNPLEKELMDLYDVADDTISTKLGPITKSYVTLYKGDTKDFFETHAAVGTTYINCREYMYGFFDFLDATAAGLTVENVKKYAGVADQTRDDIHLTELKKILGNAWLEKDNITSPEDFDKVVMDVMFTTLKMVDHIGVMCRGISWMIFSIHYDWAEDPLIKAISRCGGKIRRYFQKDFDELGVEEFDRFEALNEVESAQMESGMAAEIEEFDLPLDLNEFEVTCTKISWRSTKWAKLMKGVSLAAIILVSAFDLYMECLAIKEAKERYKKTMDNLNKNCDSYKEYYAALRKASTEYRMSLGQADRVYLAMPENKSMDTGLENVRVCLAMPEKQSMDPLSGATPHQTVITQCCCTTL